VAGKAMRFRASRVQLPRHGRRWRGLSCHPQYRRLSPCHVRPIGADEDKEKNMTFINLILLVNAAAQLFTSLANLATALRALLRRGFP